MYKGEKFNPITPLLGSVAAIVGLVVLIVTTVREGIFGQAPRIPLATVVSTTVPYHSGTGRNLFFSKE